MSDERTNSILVFTQILVSVVLTLGVVGAVPFATSVNSRLASIETRLGQNDRLQSRQDTLDERLRLVELSIAGRKP